MAKLFADSGDPDQTPCSAASDLGLHCLPSTLLRVSDYNGLNCQSQQLSFALSSACDFKIHFLQTVWTLIRLLLWEQSDQDPHCLPVCKNGLEKFARIFSRQHKQTTFSDAGFLGILRVKVTQRRNNTGTTAFK